jgi:hypothetical protein
MEFQKFICGFIALPFLCQVGCVSSEYHAARMAELHAEIAQIRQELDGEREARKQAKRTLCSIALTAMSSCGVEEMQALRGGPALPLVTPAPAAPQDQAIERKPPVTIHRENEVLAAEAPSVAPTPPPRRAKAARGQLASRPASPRISVSSTAPGGSRP